MESNNNLRPHEVLEMKTPAQIHSFSTQPFPERINHFDYHHEWKTLKVTQNEAIRWKSFYWVYLTAALKGKYIGIEPIESGIWRIYYRNVFLGLFFSLGKGKRILDRTSVESTTEQEYIGVVLSTIYRLF